MRAREGGYPVKIRKGAGLAGRAPCKGAGSTLGLREVLPYESCPNGGQALPRSCAGAPRQARGELRPSTALGTGSACGLGGQADACPRVPKVRDRGLRRRGKGPFGCAQGRQGLALPESPAGQCRWVSRGRPRSGRWRPRGRGGRGFEMGDEKSRFLPRSFSEVPGRTAMQEAEQEEGRGWTDSGGGEEAGGVLGTNRFEVFRGLATRTDGLRRERGV